MAQPTSSFGFSSSRLFDIPNLPTVARDPLGRWSALTEAVVWRYKEAAATAINDFTNGVAEQSLIEVPKSVPGESEEEDAEGFVNELADSIEYPANNEASRAHPELLVAGIAYTSIYAAVQHEGVWTMEHHNAIIPGFRGFFERSNPSHPVNVTVHWVARNYSTPGTKAHYLSDPEKAAIPRMEAEVGAKIRAELGLF